MLEQKRRPETRAFARTRITGVEPVTDCGTAPVKRSVGDRVGVSATIFRDGHVSIGGAVRYRAPGANAGRGRRSSRAATISLPAGSR